MADHPQKLTKVSELRQSILDDLFKDFADTRKRWMRTVLEPFVWFSVHRFALLAAQLDVTTSLYGFREALREFIAPMVHNVNISGGDHIPEDGPLLIVSNHPGAIDSLAIGASLPRDDLRIMATAFPMLHKLPAAGQHLIYVNPHKPMNIAGVRAAIDHLQTGGAVLIFPSGRVEPDPAILPSAHNAIHKWSPSIELFLRKVPQTQVVITIVSGVLSPIFLRNPLIRLWRDVRDPLAIAEATQIVTQMILRKRFRMTPSISFDIPHTMEELRQEYQSIYQTVLARAGKLMREHISAMEQDLYSPGQFEVR